MQENTKNDIAVLGGGCFWCTEAVFKMLDGVVSVVPGYAGGGDAPTEVVNIQFDNSKISFETLLTVFFASHDPTTKNRQGADVGPEYRSAIFYTNESQQKTATDFIAELNKSSAEGAPIVTEIVPLADFHLAEEYHRDFYAKNPQSQYCEIVINPKLKKVQERFADLLKRA